MNSCWLKKILAVSIVASFGVGVFPPATVSAAAPSLSNSDSGASLQTSGSALWGGNTSPVMSTPQSPAISPYTYGQYVVIWNFSNPNRNAIESITISTHVCVTPANCILTLRYSPPIPNRRPTADTYVAVIGDDVLHKQWIKPRIEITFSDGTPTISDWGKSRYYISDAARNELPKPSVIGANKISVPSNTAMTMTFNQWSGLDKWNVRSTIRLRSLRILRCASRPTESSSTFLSNVTTPTGCTRIASNPLLETHDYSAKNLSFTSGVPGTFIYAIDTLSFNDMPDAGDVVYLQKRSIYETFDSTSTTTVAAPAAGSGATADPGATSNTTTTVVVTEPSALASAGINLETASVVTASGQVTVNGVTLNLKAKTRFKRSNNRHNFVLSVTPQTSSSGKVTIALVKKKKGVDFVYKKVSKVTSKGRAIWKWNFATKLPAGRYRFYVTFTPSDTTLAPITLSRFIRLL